MPAELSLQMVYSVEFEINGLPRMTNASGRSKHWVILKQEADHWKKTVSLVLADRRPPKPLKYAALEFTRYSSIAPDPDGLVSGFKHVLDGLVRAGILENDKYSNIGMPNYYWVKTSPKQGKINVKVLELKGE